MTDKQCLQCKAMFNCEDVFNMGNKKCDKSERDWGTCRECHRIVSPRHSNCPKCGSTDIKPVCEELRLEEMENKKK